MLCLVRPIARTSINIRISVIGLTHRAEHIIIVGSYSKLAPTADDHRIIDEPPLLSRIVLRLHHNEHP